MHERIGSLERFVERLDERMLGKLGKDDATTLMDFSVTGDTKLREDFLGRLSDLRSAVRDGFQHNERETAASIFKAVTESEGRTNAHIQALTSQVAAIGTQLTAIAAALQDRPEKRAGWHPVPVTGATTIVVSAIWVILQMAGVRIPGG